MVLIGAHVSTGGGLDRAVERGVELRCESIQIFHQSPRMWRPTAYGEADFAAFRESFADSRIASVVIHAVYLINTASREKDVRTKSLASLEHALHVGDAIGADGVVLHAGSTKGDPTDEAIKRSGKAVREALAASERCRLLFENTAGTQGPLGRNFHELSRLLDAAGGGDRLGVCIDCCHLFASGYDIGSYEGVTEVVDDLEAEVGLDRLHCLHVNDSAVPRGANRDRHANLGKGELGRAGIRAFLSEPRFAGLPAIIETPGPEKRGPDKAEVALAKRLRREGIRRREGS
ncbi:MAG: deoxyribonuclease IV [Solirubrobacterales bacterium]